MKNSRTGFSIRKKILLLAAIVALPFVVMLAYLLASMANYSQVYDKIVRDITVANNYNLNFKESFYTLIDDNVKMNTLTCEIAISRLLRLIESGKRVVVFVNELMKMVKYQILAYILV